MTAIPNHYVTQRPIATQPVTGETAPIREAIERMRVRINASHAHRNSLNRAAHGLEWIRSQMDLILSNQVGIEGWTARHQLAASRLWEMEQQLEPVLNEETALPVEEQRWHLQAALSRAVDALALLEQPDHEAERVGRVMSPLA